MVPSGRESSFRRCLGKIALALSARSTCRGRRRHLSWRAEKPTKHRSVHLAAAANLLRDEHRPVFPAEILARIVDALVDAQRTRRQRASWAEVPALGASMRRRRNGFSAAPADWTSG